MYNSGSAHGPWYPIPQVSVNAITSAFLLSATVCTSHSLATQHPLVNPSFPATQIYFTAVWIEQLSIYKPLADCVGYSSRDRTATFGKRKHDRVEVYEACCF